MAHTGEPSNCRVIDVRLVTGRGKDAVVFDGERVEAGVADLVEMKAACLNQPVPTTGYRSAEQSQRDGLPLHNPTQKTGVACCWHGGKQGSDPSPRREKRCGRDGLQRPPFAPQHRKRRQRLSTKFDLANHSRPRRKRVQ